MARIPALEPPFTPDVGAQLATMMPAGMRRVSPHTCARCGYEYGWGVHVMVFADRSGLTPAEITSLTCGSPDDPCWTTGREAMMIRMVDALHDSSDVNDELRRGARELVDERFADVTAG
ncbi:hypothetical protein I0C86_07665 [Plantactinospora sp. S1510]|uniref:Uncharacterized protein n=1 Tax=Plantactinospora alkalitolerans TaxID=2789879 RepID=A0ABS0GSJ4_9ACTN|nr:hypothetical protein [Plantactinospora alkalitolerans]MBF9128862.1 hypothetical protein [Plantactinospora alkalitolerans]